MALAKALKQHLLTLDLPSETEMIKRTRSFMLRAGLTLEDLAEAIDYAKSSLGLFLSGKYDSNHHREQNTLKLRATLKQYMDLHDVEANVSLHGKHFDTADYVAVRRSAMNALARGTAYLLDGPPGTQKTWILRQIEREVNARTDARAVYAYARMEHTAYAFLMELCLNAGLSQRGTTDQLIRKLRFFLGNRRTLLMVDEAQHLGIQGLEVLRQLLDLPPYFGVIIAGSHYLSQRLSHWQMEQWRSRLRKMHYLNGVSEPEAELILTTELGAMSRELIKQTIADARSQASRDNKKFSYISARNLFDSIEAARSSLAETRSREGSRS